MTATAQTLQTMMETLPPKVQDSVLDKMRRVIADAVDETKWDNSYQKSSTNLEAFAQKVRGLDKKPFDANSL